MMSCCFMCYFFINSMHPKIELTFCPLVFLYFAWCFCVKTPQNREKRDAGISSKKAEIGVLKGMKVRVITRNLILNASWWYPTLQKMVTRRLKTQKKGGQFRPSKPDRDAHQKNVPLGPPKKSDRTIRKGQTGKFSDADKRPKNTKARRGF